MRIVMDIEMDASGRVSGSVIQHDRNQPVAFCGWRDLLRVLEDCAQSEPAPGVGEGGPTDP